MATKKRKVYFSAIQVRGIMTLEPIKDHDVIKRDIFDRIVENYKNAEESGDFSPFQKQINEENEDEKFFVSMLHYQNNHLCGIVSHGSPNMERYLRQRNPETFDVKELVPDAGNVFEEYSFFAISPRKMQMAYLSDPAVSSNIPSLVLSLLQKALYQNFEFEERSLMDNDIKSKIRQLGQNVIVKGTILGFDDTISGGVRSVNQIEKAMGTKFKTTVKIRAKVGRVLSDEDIDTITSLATQEQGYSSFTFADEKDADKEIIDVIKNRVRLSRTIELSIKDKSTDIWNKLCCSLNEG